MRDLSLHIMDILQNSVEANSSEINISIITMTHKDSLTIKVKDDGKGMTKSFIKNVTSPFTTTRTQRNIGLGLSLLKESVEKANGYIDIKSKIGAGTTIVASFKISHIDRLPLGDIGQTISTFIISNPAINLELKLSSDDRKFNFNTMLIKQILGDVPINDFEIYEWINGYLEENINYMFGGILNEIIS